MVKTKTGNGWFYDGWFYGGEDDNKWLQKSQPPPKKFSDCLIIPGSDKIVESDFSTSVKGFVSGDSGGDLLVWPVPDSFKIDTLDRETEVDILEYVSISDQKWYCVQLKEEIKGWIKDTQLIKEKRFEEIVKRFVSYDKPVSLRDKPAPDGTSFKVITSLKYGTQVTVLGSIPSLGDCSYDWYHVRTENGHQGWVFAGEKGDLWFQESLPTKTPPSIPTPSKRLNDNNSVKQLRAENGEQERKFAEKKNNSWFQNTLPAVPKKNVILAPPPKTPPKNNPTVAPTMAPPPKAPPSTYPKVDKGLADHGSIVQLYKQAMSTSDANLAMANFREIVGSGPRSDLADDAYYEMGEIYYDQKNFPEAIRMFQMVINSYSQGDKVPDAQLKMGYAYAELRQYNKAKNILQEVVERFYNDSRIKTLAQQKLDEINRLY